MTKNKFDFEFDIEFDFKFASIVVFNEQQIVIIHNQILIFNNIQLTKTDVVIDVKFKHRFLSNAKRLTFIFIFIIFDINKNF